MNATHFQRPSVLAIALGLGLGLGAASPSFGEMSLAQVKAETSETEPSADTAINEIVVTAQRRAESIQNVPVAVTAISAESIQDYGIHSFSDYATLVPSLSYGTGGSSGTSTQGYGISSTRQVTIRGVAGVNTTSQYIDDTPIPAAINVRVLDLERIEVLRGPQGTLFGAASMGGTIRLVSQAADLERESGSIALQSSTTDHAGVGYDVSGVSNVPLVEDSLSLRTSFYSTLTPGYYTKHYGVATVPGVAFQTGQQLVGQDDHIGENHAYGGKAALTYVPQSLPNLTVTASAIYQSEQIKGYPVSIGNPDNFTADYALNQPEGVQSNFQLSSLDARYKLGFGSLISSTSEITREAFDQEDGATWAAALTPIYFPGYVSPYLPAPGSVSFYQRIFTQELRFESNFDIPLEITSGLFYQHSYNGYKYRLDSQAISTTTGALISTDFHRDGPNIQSETAGFINLSYSLTSNLKVSAGTRISRQDFYQDIYKEGYEVTSRHTISRQDETPITPRFIVQYKFDNDDMVYGSASKGFRPGGANTPLPTYCNPEQYGFPAESALPYSSDTLWSYEVGAKNSFFDRRLTTRAAAYLIDWTNIQQSVAVPSCGVQVTQNVGAAQIRGGEYEITVVPTRGFNISGSFGYTDAKITKTGLLADGTTAGAQIGRRLNGVPEWTAALSSEYDWTVGIVDAFARGEYTFTGSSTSFTSGGPLPRAAYEIVNLRSGFKKAKWTFSAFLNNVFNRVGNLGDIADVVGQQANVPEYLVTTPRTAGVEVRRNF